MYNRKYMMIQILAFVIKEIKLLLRETGGLIFLFFIPALFIIILSIALQGSFSSVDDPKNKLAIIVINNDTGDVGDRLIKNLQDSGRFTIISAIKKKKITRAQAINEINRGRYEVAVIIPQGASAALDLQNKQEIEVLVDPALSNEFTMLATSSVNTFVQVASIEKIIGRPIPVNNDRGLFIKKSYTGLKGTEVFPNSVQQNVPGWTIFALIWIAQTLAFNLMNERLSGTYKRILVSPISWTSFVLGKGIPFFIINILQALFLFTVGVFLLPLLGCPKLTISNISGVAVITAALSFASICLGFLFVSLANSLFTVATYSVLVIIITSVIGGIMIPKFIMPEFMQRLSFYTPQGWALDGYLNILIRDYTTIQILPHAGVLILFGLLFYSISYFLFKKTSF